MREIKFRVLLEGEWHYATLDGLCKEVGWGYAVPYNVLAFSSEEAKHRTQWTGLKDSKGVEIYEGDYIKGIRIKDSPDYETREGWVEYWPSESGYVLTNAECKAKKWPTYLRYLCDYECDGWDVYEVIGNIFQHPELLGGEK